MIFFASPSIFLPLCLLSFLVVSDARLQPLHHRLDRVVHRSPRSPPTSAATLLPPPSNPDFDPLPSPSSISSFSTPYAADNHSLVKRSIVKRAIDSSIPPGFTYLGCRSDASARALTGTSRSSSANSQTTCIAYCSGKGYIYSGTQAGSQCWCGNYFDNGQGLSTTGCNTPCAGDPTQTCGGSWRSTVWRDDSPQFVAASSTWDYLGCAIDGSARALLDYKQTSAALTIDACLSLCDQQGYIYAGLEYGSECHCGSKLSNGLGTISPNPQDCSYRCNGDTSQLCGGFYRLSLYSVQQSGTCPHYNSYTPPSPPPSTSQKFVLSHHMVGNTYPYTYNDWFEDISLAYNSGADGFALNLGTDDWQLKQVTSAYAAAAAHGKDFKLFFSFDMSVWSCDAIPTTIVSYVAQFAFHPNQFWYNNRPFVSTFSGEQCGDRAWVTLKQQLAQRRIAITFVPAFFSGTSWANWISFSGVFNWNSAWSMDANPISTATDQEYMSVLGPSRTYMAGISPLFFTHYGVRSYNKNWIYQSDDWPFVVRWMQLIAMRDKLDLVQQITFNDYGESHYMGPIKGAQPNSQSWVDGFDHTVLLELNQYFAAAFKSGKYPTISCDRIYLQARPHINSAVASADSAGAPPTLGQNGPPGQLVPKNNFFVLIFATSPATIILSSGTSQTTHSVQAGISRLSSPLVANQGMRAQLIRGSKTYVNLQPSSYIFAATTTEYNFNYRFFSSVIS